MIKVIVERDGLRVEALQVSPKGVAEIIRIIFDESKSVEDNKADAVESFRYAKRL